MSYFITNSDFKNLSDRLKQLIENSESLKFLVGFFYFSGIREVYEALKNNPDVVIHLLVGLSVDKLNNKIIEYSDDKVLSINEKINNFIESIKKSLNYGSFDNREFYDQSKFFLELIQNNRLIIRKTKEPNHSKLYLFKLKSSQIARDHLFITGSSNLTKAGVLSQNEFNVEISDYGFEQAEKYFDEL